MSRPIIALRPGTLSGRSGGGPAGGLLLAPDVLALALGEPFLLRCFLLGAHGHPSWLGLRRARPVTASGMDCIRLLLYQIAEETDHGPWTMDQWSVIVHEVYEAIEK
jgi:hypothetical protein